MDHDFRRQAIPCAPRVWCCASLTSSCCAGRQMLVIDESCRRSPVAHLWSRRLCSDLAGRLARTLRQALGEATHCLPPVLTLHAAAYFAVFPNAAEQQGIFVPRVLMHAGACTFMPDNVAMPCEASTFAAILLVLTATYARLAGAPRKPMPTPRKPMPTAACSS